VSKKKQSTPLIGLDISSNAVKILQLSAVGNKYRVDGYAIEPLPTGAVVNGSVEEIDTVSEAIKVAWKRAGLKNKQVVIALGGGATMVKTIQVPGKIKDLSEEEMEDQVMVAAPDHISFPLDQVKLDFTVLGQMPGEAGAATMEVVLGYAQETVYQKKKEAVEKAGLVPATVDLEALALENAFHFLEGAKVESEDVVALFELGSTQMIMTVFKHGRAIYTREQPFESKNLETELSKRTGASVEETKVKLKHHDYDGDFEEQVMEPYREGLMQNVARSLQFFYAGSEYGYVNRVYVMGETTCMVPELCEQLEQRLGVKTELASPLAMMSCAGGVKASELSLDSPGLFLAAGLALRGLDYGVGINLNPWREKRRQTKQKAFVSQLGISAAFAAALLFGAHMVQAGWIEEQNNRNKALENGIKAMDEKIEQIQDLDVKRERLLGRKQVIEELQSSRSQMVHLFDDIVRSVPNGMYITSIVQTGSFLEIDGRAESNSRVSDYLSRLENLEWMKNPDLKYIREEPLDKGWATKFSTDEVTVQPLDYVFKLQIKLTNPNVAEEEGMGALEVESEERPARRTNK